MFKYHIVLNDEDYYEFNKFVSFCHPQGKKNQKNARIFFSIMMALIALIIMIFEGFSYYSYGTAFVFCLAIVLFNITVAPLSKLIVKLNIKSFSKSLKRPYTQDYVMEFNDESFFEITDDSKTESLYSALESISVINNKYIYLHIDRLRAYIVPVTVFSCPDECNEFLAFLSNKSRTEYYN